MTLRTDLHASAPWIQIDADDADWDAADPGLLTDMFAQLVLIRTFEAQVLEMAAGGLVHGPAHSSIGQEGAAVGSVLALKAADTVNGSHRGHHQFLAKVLHYLAPEDLDQESVGLGQIGNREPDVVEALKTWDA